MADELLAHFRKQPGNIVDHPHDRTFREIEQAAHAVGQAVARRLTAEALAVHSADQPEHVKCPQCHAGSRVTRKKREIVTGDGPVDYAEPACHCVACRRDFFPNTSATATR